MIRPWKLLKSEWALNEKWYKVRKDTVEVRPGKILDDYYVGVSNDIVMVLAITEDGIVPLVRQYKHGLSQIITELPAGYMEDGEDPLESAKRELKEETGYESDDWSKLGYFIKSAGKTVGGNIYLYLAKNAKKTSSQDLDDTEDIEIIEKPFQEVLQMAKSGELQGIDTVLALLLAEEKLK